MAINYESREVNEKHYQHLTRWSTWGQLSVPVIGILLFGLFSITWINGHQPPQMVYKQGPTKIEYVDRTPEYSESEKFFCKAELHSIISTANMGATDVDPKFMNAIRSKWRDFMKEREDHWKHSFPAGLREQAFKEMNDAGQVQFLN